MQLRLSFFASRSIAYRNIVGGVTAGCGSGNV